ncbi:MAG TPA: arsenate reductase ArsC [Xanthobacteraceae bacterium]
MAQPTPPSAPRATPPQAAPAAPQAASAPQAVLFACGLNAVRSPMAAALLRRLHGAPLYAASAGVRAGELDPFAVAVMEELGINIAGHRPITFEELEDLEGLNFDLIITLSPEAHHKALALTHRLAAEVEYWPTADPADVEGNRAQRLDAYRTMRDQLLARIRSRFP